MANIKQQVKRNLTNEKRRLQNASFKSSLKTAMKEVQVAVNNKDVEAAKVACAFACKKLDKAVAKGFLHMRWRSNAYRLGLENCIQYMKTE